MSYGQPKLHVVLTTKAKYAEFKCSLCRKLFISGYHLNSHKTRRHSHHLREQDTKLLYGKTKRKEVPKNIAEEASQRMENLLKQLNFEETRLSINDPKQYNSSTPCSSDDNQHNHLCISTLSPILYNLNHQNGKTLENLKICKLLNLISYKEEKLLELKRLYQNNLPQTIIDKALLEKQNYQRYDNNNTCSSQINEKHISSKMIDNNNEQLNEFSGGDKNLSMERQSAKIMINTSTMTENLNNNDDDDNMMAYRLDMKLLNDVSTQTEQVNTNEIVQNFTINKEINFIDEIDSLIQQNDEQFEKEFQESFEARKNFLTKEDYLTINKFTEENSTEDDNDDDEDESISAKNIQTSTNFELKNDNSIEVDQKTELTSTETCFNKYRNQVENKFSNKLRKLGIDPQWNGVKDKAYEKINALLGAKRKNIAKKDAEFMPMRTMLNNTINQILECKN